MKMKNTVKIDMRTKDMKGVRKTMPGYATWINKGSTGYAGAIVLGMLVFLALTAFVGVGTTHAGSITNCQGCHEARPGDAAVRNVPDGDYIGNHTLLAHLPDAARTTCARCHEIPTSDTNFNHRKGYIMMNSVNIAGRGGFYDKNRDLVNTLGNGAIGTGLPGSIDNAFANTAFANTTTTLGFCVNVYCHGGRSPIWGTNLAANSLCTNCHGYKSGNGFANNAAPGFNNSTAIDTDTNTTPFDNEVGAHWVHLNSPRPYMFNDVNNPAVKKNVGCADCHVVPTDANAAGHYDTARPAEVPMTSPLATNYGNATAFYCSTTHTCYNVYCHGGWLPSRSGNAVNNKPVWNSTTYLNGIANISVTGDCDKCHSSPPVNYNGSSVNNGNHAGTETLSACNGCHNGVNTSGVFISNHINGRVDQQTSCMGCHGVAKGVRRQIVGAGGDFVRTSHHVNNGTTTEIVTNWDCVLCHREGNHVTGGFDPATHQAGSANGAFNVYLRNVDNFNTGWTWNRFSVYSNGAAIAANAVVNTTMRDNMDSFCMACHDANGASTIAVNNSNNGMLIGTTNTSASRTPSGGAANPGLVNTAFRPFNTKDRLQNANDKTYVTNTGSITNTMDVYRQVRIGRVLNVKDQFNSTNQITKNWASHHNLRQFTTRYNNRNATAWPAAAWTTYRTLEGQVMSTAGEVAGLHCGDCHLNEKNAHGTTAWAMLADRNGNDTLIAALNASICHRCHSDSTYKMDGVVSQTSNERMSAHTNTGQRCQNVSSYQYNWARNECLVCHGGVGLGTIHGTNGTYAPYKGSGSTKMYRFMGTGSTMRWYSPNASTTVTDGSWEGTATGGCYTVAATTEGWQDSTNSCNSHAGGTAVTSTTRARALTY